MTDDVTAAYGRRADEYADLLGHLGAVAAPDLALVRRWASALPGPVVDAGCGPGHWTDLLRREGVDVTGVDPTPRMVELARTRFPATVFRPGRLQDLGVGDGTLAGVLAWYSLIHTPPPDVPAVLDAVVRALRPGGELLLGFVTGPDVAPFDHAVVTGYRWPPSELAARLDVAGLDVLETHERHDPGARPHGAVVARRRG